MNRPTKRLVFDQSPQLTAQVSIQEQITRVADILPMKRPFLRAFGGQAVPPGQVPFHWFAIYETGKM